MSANKFFCNQVDSKLDRICRKITTRTTSIIVKANGLAVIAALDHLVCSVRALVAAAGTVNSAELLYCKSLPRELR